MDIENANCKCRVSQCIDLEQLCIERPIKIEQEITGLQKLVEELHRVFSHDHVNIQDVQKLMAGYKSDPKDWRKYAKFDRFRYTRNLVDEGNGAFNIMIICWGPGHASAIHDHADSHCFMKVLSGELEEIRYEWPDIVEPEVLRKLRNKTTPRRRCCSESEDKILNKTAKLNLCENESCDNYGKDIDSKNGDQNGEIENKTDEHRNESGQCNNGNGEYKNGNGEIENQNGGNDYGEEYDAQSMSEIGRTRLEVNDVCYINDALGLHRMENPSHVDSTVSLHLYCPPFDACRVFDARTGKPTQVKVTFWSKYGKTVKRVIEAAEIADSQ
ncbi:cysteine dioxygenase [Hyposmocoma kahamanoa]|uniref:cysteine dioxygenase n=1 Tax=Hyposmocoma kahamanoa TaxID=1477025 RepID=UPI000E6D779E|nr:cysteine dioxygenase [Hyposmocoma kahamanoa]